MSDAAKPRRRRVVGAVCGLEGQELHVGVEDGFAPARRTHPAFRVGSPDRLAALAERIGAVEWDDGLAGSARFYARDPFGNRLEFLARR